MDIPGRHIKLLLFAFIGCQFSFAQSVSKKEGAISERRQIAIAMEQSLKHDLLDIYYPRSLDTVYGGFLSTFTYDFKPTGSQEKMIVTQSRHTWTNSKAGLRYPDKLYYRRDATAGFHFLADVMWDKQYGGFYTLVSRKGEIPPGDPADKNAYGNAFGMYALSAYYQLTGDTSALSLAKKTFYWLEAHSHDPQYKGYFQHLKRNGEPIRRTANTPVTAETGYKDQNSSIHLLEALTELYEIWKDPLVRERLQEMLFLIRDTIITRRGNLGLFFTWDWKPVSVKDSSREFILHHHNLDYISFGHDVETAYLMLEASQALGIKNDSITLMTGKKMVDHALKNGWDKQVGGFYDEGFYFKGDSVITILKESKNWWAQAEGLNSLLLMSDYFPHDPHQYFEKFKTQWTYIQTYLIDHQWGDWYDEGLDKSPERRTALKSQIWKATYHNYRSLSNCVDRLNNHE
jgi:mannose/cellobiose epimerase-like protein (N-acyl-D-glucosamine 2-epimerase family)